MKNSAVRFNAVPSVLINIVLSLSIAFAFVLATATAGRATSDATETVLHDCLLVFRYGDDPRYGVTLHGSEARDINNRGDIVGWSVAADGDIHAMLWHDQIQTDLGTLGGKNSCALGINDAGQVVGWAENENGERHAARWEDGHVVDLGTFPGEDSVAFAINEAGETAGLTWPVVVQLVFPVGRAVVWDDGEMIDLSAGINVAGSGAYGINDLGEVVGWVVPNGGSMRAVRWLGDDARVLTVDGLDRSLAFANDEFGRVVGWAEIPNGEIERHAALWIDDQPVLLQNPRTGSGEPTWAEASDINSRGDVAGAVADSDGDLRGVVWRTDANTMDLLGTLGGSKSEAYAINDAGQVVGWSSTGDDEPRAFMWHDGTMIDLTSAKAVHAD